MTTLTVTQLNRQIRLFLEQDIGEIAVIGELSSLSKPASGHLYFTLKDEQAQLKCAFFRNYQLNHTDKTLASMQKENAGSTTEILNAKSIKEGQKVIAKGLISLYEARGDYQLIVYELTPYGLGELYRQFELLKIKLEQQGLFSPSRKRPIPLYPQHIAVITSEHGAALHDILITLKRRYPSVAVDIYPSEVQGKNAASQLIARIKQITQAIIHNKKSYDALLLARGGGSIEDLWAFNDEQLAFAIYNSPIPVITGIGHESDFTIADFVADLRAATPTAAAEAVTPQQTEIERLLLVYIKRLTVAMQQTISQHRLRIFHLNKQLTYPGYTLHRHTQTLDFLQQQLQQHIKQQHQCAQHQLQITLARLLAKNPVLLLERANTQLKTLTDKLFFETHRKIQRLKETFSMTLATFHAVSPLATLARGYAIVTHHKQVVYSSQTIDCGDQVEVQLAEGTLLCEVITCLKR